VASEQVVWEQELPVEQRLLKQKASTKQQASVDGRPRGATAGHRASAQTTLPGSRRATAGTGKRSRR